MTGMCLVPTAPSLADLYRRWACDAVRRQANQPEAGCETSSMLASTAPGGVMNSSPSCLQPTAAVKTQFMEVLRTGGFQSARTSMPY